MCTSASQTCPSRNPNQGSDYVLLVFTLNILRRKKNTEQHSGFGTALPTEESYITHGGNLPHFGNHWRTLLKGLFASARKAYLRIFIPKVIQNRGSVLQQETNIDKTHRAALV